LHSFTKRAMIDSSLLGLEGTAQLIISVADKKFGL
jgi:hypothetical protein